MSSQNTAGNNPRMSSDAPRNVLLALRAQPLFANLTDDEFQDIIALLHSETIELGDLIVDMGGTNTRYYVLRSGRAVVRRLDDQGAEYIAQQFRIGDAFNDRSFLTGARSEESIEAVEKAKLWYLARDEFQALLQRRPSIKQHLQYPPEVIQILNRLRRRDWLRPDENELLYRKKHPLVFIGAFITALLVYALIMVLTYVLAQSLFPPIAGLATLFMAGFTLWRFYDWRNDFYAVTDQRVVHRERVLLASDKQNEIQLHKIQDVTVRRQAFIEMLFDIGSVVIQAAGMGSVVVFELIGSPDDVTRLIYEQRTRAMSQTRASERAKIRSEIRRELELAPRPKAAAPAHEPTRTTFRKRLRRSFSTLGQMRSAVLPHMRLVQGNQIVYRKHWLVLVGTAWFPALCLLLYTGVIIALVAGSQNAAELFSQTCVVLPAMLMGLGLAFWLLWRYEDWRNDIYILTSDRLVDIDRSPFGLQGTKRRDASLSAVQNVTSSTQGPIDLLFDMGNVVIRTAGAGGDLTFDNVHNPRSVQRDIMNRMEAFESSVREQQAASRRQELAEWLGIYDELTRLHERKQMP